MRRPVVVWVIAGVLGAATVFWLGYATGRVHNIVEVAQLERDADTDRYSIGRGQLLLHFERLGGAGKPYIRSGDGLELVELSDWDRDSRIVVDGTLYELVRLYPQSSADYARSRIAETLNGDGWLLQREVTLESDNTVTVNHLFVARRAIRRVDLSVAHVHRTFVDLQVDETSVVGTLNRLTQDQIAAGVADPPAYRVSARAAPDSAPIQFRYGTATAYGPTSFVADMAAEQPRRDTRVSMGTEVIRVERVDTQPASAEAGNP